MFVASSAANVTARIDGGGGRFRVESVACQLVVEQRLTAEEIAQLPARLRNDPRYWVSVERTLIGTSDGTTPLAVAPENEVVVSVAYRGEDVAGEGVHSAALVILGTGRDPISVPVSALVAEVKAEVPSATLSVVQGQVATLAVTVRSAFGPDTNVRFEMDTDTGVAMDPVAVFLPRRGQARASLQIKADRGPT